MSEFEHAGSGGGGGAGHPGGHKINPKLLVALAGVVIVLFFMRARSGSSASAAPPAQGVPSTDQLSQAEQSMLAQLQSDAADLIAADLAQIPAGAQGPTGPAGKQGPPGKPGPTPPATVHKPISHPGARAGVPAAHGYYYTVHAGDTLSSIAAHAHVSSWHALVNGRTDPNIDAHPDLIRPNQRVWIPQRPKGKT